MSFNRAALTFSLTAGFGLLAPLSLAQDAAEAPPQKAEVEMVGDDAGSTRAQVKEMTTDDPGPGSSADQTSPSAGNTSDSFTSQVDRLSYAIGMDIGNSFKGQSIEINPDVLAQGMSDAYSGGQVKLTDEQAMAAIQQFQQEMQAKQMQMMMQEQEQAMSTNTAEGEEFLAKNKEKEGVQTTDSGLQYKIIEEGEGKKPGPNDQVTVHYKGQLINGEVFDSSYDNGEPVTFGIDQVIPGFGEGLQLMPVGSKGKLFIPGDIAYGMQGGPGGPNATLIFDVEVIDTQSPQGGGSQLPALGD